MNNALIQRIVHTQPAWAPVVLRITAGMIFAAHGGQKLFGWFGGSGLEGASREMESFGLGPGYLMALLAGSAEFFGGLALMPGALVRPAAAVLAFTMVMAISVHFGNGLFLANDGYEYTLALLVVTLSLVISGAGSASLDRRLQWAYSD